MSGRVAAGKRSESTSMGKTVVATARAPQAIGPYVQATKVGDLVFCSGQIALDPSTGEMVPGGVEPETHRVLDNLAAVLDVGLLLRAQDGLQLGRSRAGLGGVGLVCDDGEVPARDVGLLAQVLQREGSGLDGHDDDRGLQAQRFAQFARLRRPGPCLLYTSDAADE